MLCGTVIALALANSTAESRVNHALRSAEKTLLLVTENFQFRAEMDLSGTLQVRSLSENKESCPSISFPPFVRIVMTPIGPSMTLAERETGAEDTWN